jgi:hypothetical protein
MILHVKKCHFHYDMQKINIQFFLLIFFKDYVI